MHSYHYERHHHYSYGRVEQHEIARIWPSEYGIDYGPSGSAAGKIQAPVHLRAAQGRNAAPARGSSGRGRPSTHRVVIHHRGRRAQGQRF